MTLSQCLDQMPGFHHLVRWLRIRQIMGGLLRRFPVVRTLPDSGVKYRLRYLETFFLADEFFKRQVYGHVVEPHTKNFIDLGCNAGLFAALIAHETGRRDLRGLMVDANEEMVAESRWLLAANGLREVQVLHGLVGAEHRDASAEFYLLPSNLGSSQFPVYEPGKPPKGDWKKTTVPCLDLEAVWRKHFGNERCHLAKVDIEGSEKNLFHTDGQFFQRVDRMVLEWHQWIIPRQELEKILAAQQFHLVRVLHEVETSGIALYQRASSPPNTA